MTSASLMERAHDTGVVDDPAARPRRRTFNAEYKARILAEYDAVPAGSPERGALLRREGLYTSHIAEWRKARDTAGLDALAPKGRPAKRSAEQVELEKLRRRPPDSRRSWPAPAWRWRSREKRMRSWRCSPRARTPS